MDLRKFRLIYPRSVGEMWFRSFRLSVHHYGPHCKALLCLWLAYPDILTRTPNQSQSSRLNLTNPINKGNQSKAAPVSPVYSTTAWSVIGYMSHLNAFLNCWLSQLVNDSLTDGRRKQSKSIWLHRAIFYPDFGNIFWQNNVERALIIWFLTVAFHFLCKLIDGN